MQIFASGDGTAKSDKSDDVAILQIAVAGLAGTRTFSRRAAALRSPRLPRGGWRGQDASRKDASRPLVAVVGLAALALEKSHVVLRRRVAYAWGHARPPRPPLPSV